MINCLLYKKLGDTDALRLSLAWGIPSRRVGKDLNINVMLFDDSGSSVCIVQQDISSK